MGTILEAILAVIWWPYAASRKSGEDSLLGESELDRDAARFWRRIATGFTILLLAVALVLIGIWFFVFR